MVTGWLTLDGWAGRTRQAVELIGQTPTRWRIRAIQRTRLAGRRRALEPGQTALVPRRALRDNCVRCKGAKGGVPGNENVIHGRAVCDYCHAEMLIATARGEDRR